MSEQGGRDETRELRHAECWRLLGEYGVGHLALRAHPVGVDVLPIDYRITRRELYFRTGWGTKLMEALEHPHVAVQVDRLDDDHWYSIVLKGEAERILDDDARRASGASEIIPHEEGEKDFVVRIRPTGITGRSFPRRGGELRVAPEAVKGSDAAAREAALD